MSSFGHWAFLLMLPIILTGGKFGKQNASTDDCLNESAKLKVLALKHIQI